MNQCQPQPPVDTTLKFANISLSSCILVSLFLHYTTLKFANISPSSCILVSLFLHYLTLNIRLPLCKDGHYQEKGLYQVEATLKKQAEGQPSKGTGSSHPSTKRKQLEKTDHLPKKPKTVPEPVVGLKAEIKKLGPGKGNGLMTGLVPITEKAPILLR